MPYAIYILECRDGTYYTGYTTDISRRVETHNSGKGAKYTRGRLPVKLVYSEHFDTESAARKREYEIKQLSRAEKKFLIDGDTADISLRARPVMPG